MAGNKFPKQRRESHQQNIALEILFSLLASRIKNYETDPGNEKPRVARQKVGSLQPHPQFPFFGKQLSKSLQPPSSSWPLQLKLMLMRTVPVVVFGTLTEEGPAS